MTGVDELNGELMRLIMMFTVSWKDSFSVKTEQAVPRYDGLARRFWIVENCIIKVLKIKKII
tara:strand:- start:2872 stop:3057 length:186 start_codon:yes stop_codon:yes gene_type:complete